MLTRQHRQEGLSRAYVQAIAALCGMSVSSPTPDYGTDFSLHAIEARGLRRSETGFRIDIQAKSTTGAAVQQTHVRYDLDANAYEYLRRATPWCPRLLVVLILPANAVHWSTQMKKN